MPTCRFEPLTEDYLQDVLEIYNHYILNSTATFHGHPLTEEEMRGIVFFSDSKYQTYGIFDETGLCGYVLLTRYKPREAYDGTAEVTIYLRPETTGKGIGSRAVQFIEGIARERGFHVLVAGICGENEASIRVFARNGFAKCAHFKEVGRKFGRRLDVVYYQKIIG